MNYDAAINENQPQQNSQGTVGDYLNNPNGLFNDPNNPKPGITPLSGGGINASGAPQPATPPPATAQPPIQQPAAPAPIQPPTQAPIPTQITPTTQSGDMLSTAENNFAALPGGPQGTDSSQSTTAPAATGGSLPTDASAVAPIPTQGGGNQGNAAPGVQGLSLQLDQQGQALQQAAQGYAKTPTTSGATTVGLKYAAQAVLGYLNNREAAAVMNNRENQQTWSANADKYLNPNSDIKPDLDAYLRSMPLSTDALQKSTLTGGNMSKSAGGKGALGVLTGGLSALMPSGEAEYAFNKGGEGAAAGSVAGGWIGAIVGGVVGVAEGIIGWGDASAKDDQQRQQARDEYLQAMKVWQKAQNDRIFAQIAKKQAESNLAPIAWADQVNANKQAANHRQTQGKYFQMTLYDKMLLGGVAG